MRLIWLCILGCVVIWPVHWTAATVGDKPIDLMLSDLLCVLLPPTYLLLGSDSSKSELNWVRAPIRMYTLTPALALVFIIYATTLAGVGLGMSGETVRLYSAFKLAKPIGFVFLGMLLGSWTDPINFIKVTSRVYGVLVALSMFFTVTAPEFPLGEWGKYLFFELELSGYPNSPMSFYAAMVPLLLASVECRQGALKFVGWGLAGCAALMIVGSMSRSSTLALICGVSLYLILTGRTPYLIIFILLVTALSVVGYGLFSLLRETEMVTVLENRVRDRLDRSTESEDPSSGRFEIWQLAIELWAERPAFGYMFESFSRYADVDTPHQQYLEVLHKCGGIGLLLYLALLFSCLANTRRLALLTSARSPSSYLLHAMTSMLAGVMIGNLTQPNLTYSLTGNMVFLLFGCLCSSRAVVSASQPSAETLRRAMMPQIRKPLPRIAA